MSQEKRNDTWCSPNEFQVSERELEFVAQLEVTDQRIGEEVSAKYGRGTIAKRSIPVRLVRRALFELKKVVGPAARKVQRFGSRQWHRRIADRRRVNDATQFNSLGHSFEVIALSSLEARERAKSSRAEFLVFTREPNTMLHSAIDSIGAAVDGSSSQMWFGDSRNLGGVRERRPRFNRLMLRQVDALGPVIIVRSNALKSEQIQNINPVLWPLHFGLTFAEFEVELIPKVLGVGDVTVSNINDQDDEAANLVRAELQLSGIAATVETSQHARRRVHYSFDGSPKVSIVIPTRGTIHDGTAFVVEAVKSIMGKSTYKNLEIVIVADDPTPQSVVTSIDEIAGDIVRWVRWSEPFNFSRKMNLGAACASGTFLLFLNDDIEVVSPGWVDSMLSLIAIDGIGYTGALLFFDDQSVQHAGHVYFGGPGHIGFGEVVRRNDSNQTLTLDRITTGVTAACSLVTKKSFEQAGGFSPLFPGNYNDVDLSLKLSELGEKSAVAGGACLYHFESKSRDATVLRSEIEQLHLRWVRRMESDENYRGLESSN